MATHFLKSDGVTAHVSKTSVSTSSVNEQTPCIHCGNELGDRPCLKCDRCEWLCFNCLEESHIRDGRVQVLPAALFQYTEDKIFEFHCYYCDVHSKPLPVSLIEQKVVTLEEILQVYQNYPDIVEYIRAEIQGLSTHDTDMAETEVKRMNPEHMKSMGDYSRVNMFDQRRNISESRMSTSVQMPQSMAHENTVKEVEPTSMKMLLDFMERQLELERARTERAERNNNVAQFVPSTTEYNSQIQKLPKLKIPQFSGIVLEWKTFWDTFKSAIHDKERLPTIEKFHYLKMHLSGEAKQSLEGLEVTADNYDIAVDILKQRYGDINKVIMAHLEGLQNIMTVYKPVYTPLQRFFDLFQAHFRSLCALHMNDEAIVNLNYSILTPSLFSKLPHEIQWRMLDKNPKLKNNLSSFRDALSQVLTSVKEMDSNTFSIFDRLPSAKPQFQTGNKYQSENDGKKKTIQHTVGFLGASSSNNNNSGKPKNSLPHQSGRQIEKKQAERKCRYCDMTDHYTDECRKYGTIDARKARLNELSPNNSFCVLCLRVNHRTRNCNLQNKRQCAYCKGSHHRSLCYDKYGRPTVETSHMNLEKEKESPDKDNTNEPGSLAVAFAAPESLPSGNVVEKTYTGSVAVPMQFVKCYVQNKTTGVKTKVNLLIDSGTKRSFIKQKVCENLGFRVKKQENLSVCTFTGSEPTVLTTGQVDLSMELTDGSLLNMTAHTAPHLSSKFRLDAVPLSQNDRKLVKQYCTMEQISEKPRDIELDMLLGQDYWPYTLVDNQKKVQLEKSGVYLVQTKLGWLPSGLMTKMQSKAKECTTLTLMGADATYVQLEEDKYLDSSIEQMWNLESIGISDQENMPDDVKAQEIFDENVSFHNNRVWVCWPFKQKNPKLPDNYFQAYKRLQIMLKVLEKNPDVAKKYITNFEDQLEGGIIEKIDEKVRDGPLIHYIPHQAVITPQKQTTKLRIVFDASAKADRNSLSLNECLYRGPVLLSDLCGLLVRFRLKPIVLLSDIEKAFLQIALYPKDREVTRFLWLKDPTKLTTKNNIQVFRFCRVPFGVVTSPYLLAASIRWLLAKFDTKVAQEIKENLYVDNVITGTETVNEALTFYKEAKEIFNYGSMNLREWTSNSQEFIESIPEADRAKGETQKVLGVPWNLKEDTMSIPVPPKLDWENCKTKRQVLKCLASVFDPLGFSCCFVIGIKIFLQSLWKEQFDWDSEFPLQKQKEWQTTISHLDRIRDLTIPRLCQIPTCEKLNLICFVDASKEAYGVVLYLHAEDLVTRVCSPKLLFAKARVIPKSGLSVPRAELIAALLGVRCLKFIENELRLPIQKKVLWSDSCCVLNWIHTEKPLKVFVENRVREIRSSDDIEFRYVPTAKNVADYVTKKTLPSSFNWIRWLNGPQWLQCSYTDWEIFTIESKEILEVKSEMTKEYRKLPELFSQVGESTDDDTVQNCENSLSMLAVQEQKTGRAAFFQSNIQLQKVIPVAQFSDVQKLYRVTAWIYRYLHNLRNKKKQRLSVKQVTQLLTKNREKLIESIPMLEVYEIQQAKRKWEISVQKEFFLEKLEDPKNGQNFEIQHSIIFEYDGLIKCATRLGYSTLSKKAKYPKLLPKLHDFTKMVMKYFHEKFMHVGTNQTLAMFRQEYWCSNARNQVKWVVKNCTLCKKTRRIPYAYPISTDLPSERVIFEAPFAGTGVDIFGPFWCRNNSKQKKESCKVWVCIFVCMQIRAVHTETVTDLKVNTILNACRRFFAFRGKPKLIISDNASQFQYAKLILESSKSGIKWQFISVNSPWKGGMYERLIGITKAALKKALARNAISLDQFQTVLAEVVNVVNSRPLTYVSGELSDFEILTPNKFLCLNPGKIMPMADTEALDDPDYDPKPLDSRLQIVKLWKYGQLLFNKFWENWQHMYLTSLREQHMRDRVKEMKRKTETKYMPLVHDIVIIKRRNIDPNFWPMGKIVELYPDKEGDIRTAKLVYYAKNRKYESNEAIKNLCPIELSVGNHNVQFTETSHLINSNKLWKIVVEGNIGSGKTTLLNTIEKLLRKENTVILREPVENWQNWKNPVTHEKCNLLEKFYLEKEKYTQAFQLNVILSMTKMSENGIKEAVQSEKRFVIQERSQFSSVNVFCPILLDDIQCGVIKTLCDALSKSPPDEANQSPQELEATFSSPPDEANQSPQELEATFSSPPDEANQSPQELEATFSSPPDEAQRPPVYETVEASGKNLKSPANAGQGPPSCLVEVSVPTIHQKDIVIYLRTSPEVCLKRMKIRGRKEENVVSLNDLEVIHSRYETWFMSGFPEYGTSRILTINGDEPLFSIEQALKRIFSPMC